MNKFRASGFLRLGLGSRAPEAQLPLQEVSVPESVN